MDGAHSISRYFAGVTLLKMGSWTEVVLGVIRSVFLRMIQLNYFFFLLFSTFPYYKLFYLAGSLPCRLGKGD